MSGKQIAGSSTKREVPTADERPAFRKNNEPDRLVDPLVGAIFNGKYQLIEKIGEGGMGAVYLAIDLDIRNRKQRGKTTADERVAIKVLHKEGEGSAEHNERFRNEAKTLTSVLHRNVLRIRDMRIDGNRRYIVSEYLEGISLRSEMRKRQLYYTWEETKKILLEVCEGLGAVHAQGIVHRDMKPDNIFLAIQPDGTTVPKILDFGLAKLQYLEGAPNDTKSITTLNQVMGTPHYMSPEQAVAAKYADQRSDIYGLGAVMYFMLTAEHPADGDSLAEIMKKLISENPRPPSEVEPKLNIPPEVDRIVMKCLEKRPQDRYQSVEELVRDMTRETSAQLPSISREEFRTRAGERYAKDSDSDFIAKLERVRTMELTATQGMGTGSRKTLKIAVVSALVAGIAATGYAYWSGRLDNVIKIRGFESIAKLIPSTEPSSKPVEQKPKQFNVAIKTNVPEAEVYKKGSTAALGKTDENGAVTVMIESGRSEMVIKKPGFKDEYFSVNLDADVALTFKLKPLKPGIKKR